MTPRPRPKAIPPAPARDPAICADNEHLIRCTYPHLGVRVWRLSWSADISNLVRHLAVPVWTESGVEDHGVKLPTWPDIEAAIGGLDGHTRTEAYLHPRRNDPETYMAIAGGSDNHYLVFLCHHNERFDEAVTPDAPDRTVSMVTGGQLGEFQLEDLITLDEALEAARVYHQSGQLAGGVTWRHR